MVTKSDYDFHLTRVRTYTALVEGLSTLSPLCGKLPDKAFRPAMAHLIHNWRMRLSALRQSQCYELQGTMFRFARNCRPCSSVVVPANAPVCKQRICPFCHGRRAAAVFQRARTLVENYRESGWPVSVVSYARVYDSPEADYGFDSGSDLATQLLEEVIPQELRRRSAYEETVLGVTRRKPMLGGAYLISIIPVVHEDGCTGRWTVRHGSIYLAEPGWEARSGPSLYRQEHVLPTPRKLAWVVSHAFRYPTAWMTCNETVMATMLDATHRQRFMFNTGVFRGAL